MSKPEPGEVHFLRNDVTRQFEIKSDGKKAFIEFEVREGKMFLTGAEIPIMLKDQGLGDVLVERTLQYLEEIRMPLVPMSAVVTNYLRQHPEWQRILAKGIQISSRERF